MNTTQSTIDRATNLKNELLNTAISLKESKEIIESTTYDNLKNKHNTVWETFSVLYNKIYGTDDESTQMQIMDIEEELKQINFKLENAIANYASNEKMTSKKSLTGLLIGIPVVGLLALFFMRGKKK